MDEPVWLDKALILALYEDVVTASGGAFGVRDEASSNRRRRGL